jgi:hypothetical protein
MEEGPVECAVEGVKRRTRMNFDLAETLDILERTPTVVGSLLRTAREALPPRAAANPKAVRFQHDKGTGQPVAQALDGLLDEGRERLSSGWWEPEQDHPARLTSVGVYQLAEVFVFSQ